jgi:hypothetical protein
VLYALDDVCHTVGGLAKDVALGAIVDLLSAGAG